MPLRAMTTLVSMYHIAWPDGRRWSKLGNQETQSEFRTTLFRNMNAIDFNGEGELVITASAT